MSKLDKAKESLIGKIDDLFGFNLSNRQDGISYDFGQYRLNKLYKPLVKYFIDQYMSHLEQYSQQETEKILWLFSDFFSLYYSNWDFWYFKNKFSTYQYRIPYSGKDTEFWRATKDCYYVKTSDVVNDMAVSLWGIFENREVQIKMFKKTESIKTDSGEDKYTFDVQIEDIIDEESEEITWYKVIFINYEESKDTKKQKETMIADVLESKWIQYSNPAIKKAIDEFLKKRGRDYFIHKRLKAFLTEELERYFFQMLKTDMQAKADILSIQKKIEEIKAKYSDDRAVIDFKIGQLMKESQSDIKLSLYETSYLWILNFVNILADLEELKKKIYQKNRNTQNINYVANLWTLKGILTESEFKNIHSMVKTNIIENNLYQEEYFKILKEKYRNIDMTSAINVESTVVIWNQIKIDYCRIKEINEKIQIIWDEIWKINKNWALKSLWQVIWKLKKDDKEYVKFNLTEDDYQRTNSCWVTLYKRTIDLSNDYMEMYLDTDLLSLEDKIFCNSILVKYEKELSWLAINADNEQAMWWLKQQWKSIDLARIDPPFNTENNQFYYKDNYLDSTWSSMMLQRIILIEELLTEKGSFYIHLDDNADHIARTLMKDTNFIFRNQIIAKHFWWRMNDKKKIYEAVHDVILFYTKSDNYNFNYLLIEGEWEEKYKYITSVYDKYITTKYSQFNYKENISWESVGETTQKTEDYMQKYIRVSSNIWDVVMDCFAGTGTTLATAHKFNRKWIGINISEKFHNLFTNRMKKVLIWDMSWVSKESDVNWKWGGFFCWIKLNQYEDRFNVWWYLDKIEWDINHLSNADVTKIWDIKQVLFPLSQLKDRIYRLDDE